MAVFIEEIGKLVSDGLNDLAESIESGKTPGNPVSETHFLSAWVTKSIKQQRYDHRVAKTLLAWQQQARSMGKNAQLKQQFEQIRQTLTGLNPDGTFKMAVMAEQIQALYQALAAADWLVTTEYEVNRKVTHHTDGQASLVVCAKQYREAIAESGEVAKPLSLYLRGDAKAVVDTAYQHGLLLFKVTDYKSKVKYHGEYVIYPGNQGAHLPELPAQADQ
ncbi:DUF2913 family protein [Photobacterium atrarenae]|uniref:DUF2913 family protein n=1 Tax=Photobacterium atrarenae TaxID=865757 RepID=A0ABY5GI09_9GAMM|nr:DUF2913 family protein [Photobacterium atrarenae]UTV28925.1 DUF2913 family protein [Photobacterium atrarenae]